MKDCIQEQILMITIKKAIKKMTHLIPDLNIKKEAKHGHLIELKAEPIQKYHL